MRRRSAIQMAGNIIAMERLQAQAERARLQADIEHLTQLVVAWRSAALGGTPHGEA